MKHRIEIDHDFELPDSPEVKRYHRNMVIGIIIASALIVSMFAFLGVVFANWLLR